MTDWKPALHAGRRVRVHTNRHHIRRGLGEIWSVLDAETHRLVGYRETITLVNCKHVVRPGGLRRFRDGAGRSVFAWVEGTIAEDERNTVDGQLLTFNPITDDCFRLDGEPQHTSKRVTFYDDHIEALA